MVARARLLTIPAGNFLEHLRHNPDLALNLLAAMYRHLRRLVRQVEQLTNLSSVQRVADFLLRLCPPGEQQPQHAGFFDKAKRFWDGLTGEDARERA